MSFDRNQPYNALPELPPSGVDLNTVPILKWAIPASRALAELKGAGNLIPNQQVLLAGVVMQEARLSSEIENIVTTNNELYEASAKESAQVSQHTKEVLRYQRALWEGYESLGERSLNINLFVRLMQIIKQQEVGIRKVPGTKLTGNDGNVVYTPPESEAVLRDKLKNLERFIHADDDGVDPLVKLAVMHYQFEAIHPFSDGNGRTGRIINILYLVEKGLLELPVLYLSHFIIGRKNDYYDGLRRVTEEGAWEDWIIFILTGIQKTARQTHAQIIRIREAMDETAELARQKVGKAYSRELIELVFEQPYCKIKLLEQRGIAKRQTASTYLQAFAEAGLLKAVKKGRDIYYINERLLNVINQGA